MRADITIIQEGDASRRRPFTICFISNPVLEKATGGYAPDSIISRKAEFYDCVTYAYDCLFGNLPGQSELFLGDSEIKDKIKVVAIFLPACAITDEYCMVSEYFAGYYLMPRRDMFMPLINKIDESIYPDVIYAISGSYTHFIAAAQYTNDDESSPGIPFKLNSAQKYHRYYNIIPGTVGMHCSQRMLGPIHEFAHAVSSYENGMVVDLYNDKTPYLPMAINKNRPQPPLPQRFADYSCGALTISLDTDGNRGGLGYPRHWSSFHCELYNPKLPGIMDSWVRQPQWVMCEHDRVTRHFLLDRVRAKLKRP